MLWFMMFKENILPFSKNSNMFHYIFQPQHSFPVKISRYKRNKLKHHQIRTKRKSFHKRSRKSSLLNYFQFVSSLFLSNFGTSSNVHTHSFNRNNSLNAFISSNQKHEFSYDDNDLNIFLSNRDILNSVKVLKILLSRDFLSSNHLLETKHLSMIGSNI